LYFLNTSQRTSPFFRSLLTSALRLTSIVLVSAASISRANVGWAGYETDHQGQDERAPTVQQHPS
ncbi:hypothetical protein, partial [Maritalea sp.]|uniref:hypothetical protein n=1 Tax=Maritalea sp. TaxID=2003361 RepID=UPI003EFAB4D6